MLNESVLIFFCRFASILTLILKLDTRPSISPSQSPVPENRSQVESECAVADFEMEVDSENDGEGEGNERTEDRTKIIQNWTLFLKVFEKYEGQPSLPKS